MDWSCSIPKVSIPKSRSPKDCGNIEHFSQKGLTYSPPDARQRVCGDHLHDLHTRLYQIASQSHKIEEHYCLIEFKRIAN